MPKAMRWGSKHTDKYIYNPELRCTAPETLPRGTKFDYNCRLTPAEEYVIE